MFLVMVSFLVRESRAIYQEFEGVELSEDDE
jgi:hypothetical protein